MEEMLRKIYDSCFYDQYFAKEQSPKYRKQSETIADLRDTFALLLDPEQQESYDTLYYKEVDYLMEVGYENFRCGFLLCRDLIARDKDLSGLDELLSGEAGE